jgi:hypothetical protein
MLLVRHNDPGIQGNTLARFVFRLINFPLICSMRDFFYYLVYFFLLLSCVHGVAQDFHLDGKGYDMHTELQWDSYPGADRYRIWRKAEQEPDFKVLTTTIKNGRIDWTGRTTDNPFTHSYYLEALNVPGAIIGISDTITTTVSSFSDDQFLDMTQEYTFRYFYDYAHPVSGMARERFGSDDIVTTGGSGFGIMAIITGVYRGYITRTEGMNRLLKIAGFLQFAEKFHGAFPHWMNGQTGQAIPFSTFDDGGDLVETAFLMQGLLCAREYFNQDTPGEIALRAAITGLWEDVEWDWYSRNDSGVLYWHWSPNFSWQMNFPIVGYNEALIVYLLAIASPTHPVDAEYYHEGWAGGNYTSGFTWYGTKLFVGPPLGGPLFFAHYSYMGFDPRYIKDAYANYFEQNRNHTIINRSWCVDNPFNYEGYSESCWGLTASDDPWGYSAHAPGGPSDNGTITPAAAIPSMPYTPAESIQALKHFYHAYGEQLWGEYGFYDAFNLEENWFADSYIAIDQGPIINMIENYRSGILWESFMANPEIEPALDAIGFVDDLVDTKDLFQEELTIHVYPTISDGELYVQFPGNREWDAFHFRITDVMGRSQEFRQFDIDDEIVRISFSQKADHPGWYWLSVFDDHRLLMTLPFWNK